MLAYCLWNAQIWTNSENIFMEKYWNTFDARLALGRPADGVDGALCAFVCDIEMTFVKVKVTKVK